MKLLHTFEEVLAETKASRGEIAVWIEQRWILPVEQDGAYLFDEADRTRISMIIELRRDLVVNDEAVPAVLHLMDQVQGLRKALDELQEAIKGISAEARAELEAQIRKTSSS